MKKALLEESVVPDTKPVKAEPKKRGRPRKQKNEEVEEPSSRSRCTAYAPRGTVCKFCRKVHPL
jgi:hypothetical protein